MKKTNIKVLTQAPGTEYPYLPQVKTEIFNVRKHVGHMNVIEFTCVLRIKGDDGLYRDVVCKQKHETPVDLNETSYRAQLRIAEVASRAIGHFYNTIQLYDPNRLSPSEYQVDELERIKALLP